MTDQMTAVPAVPTEAVCVHTSLSQMTGNLSPDPVPLGSCGRPGFLFRAEIDGTPDPVWLHATSVRLADEWARWLTPGGSTATVEGPSGPSTVNADGTITHQPPPSTDLGPAADTVAAAVAGTVCWSEPYPTVGWEDVPGRLWVVEVDRQPALLLEDADGRMSLPAPLPADAVGTFDGHATVRWIVSQLRQSLDTGVQFDEPSVWLVDLPVALVDDLPAHPLQSAVANRLIEHPTVRAGGAVGGLVDAAPGAPVLQVLDVVEVAVDTARSRAVAVVRARPAVGMADGVVADALASRFLDSAMLWRDGDDPELASDDDVEVAEVLDVPTVTRLPLSGRAHTDAVRAASEMLGVSRRQAATAVSQFGAMADRTPAARRAFVFLLADMAAGRTSGAALEALWALAGTPFGRDGSVWTAGLAGTVVTVDPSDLSTVEDGGVAVPTGLPPQCPNPWRVVRALASLGR